MCTILDRIVAYKWQEIDQARRSGHGGESLLEKQALLAPPARPFTAALRRGPGVQVLAEVKKASPSAGVIREDFDPVAIARIYEQNGAACVSVLTDTPSFQGRLDYLAAIRSGVGLPVLRKDFLLDRIQLLEARAAGADAVLLIAEILPGDSLLRLFRETNELGMEALVEIYDRENLPRVLRVFERVASSAPLLGINNRDLRTFVTRLEHTLELADEVPDEVCLVSESGIRTRADVEQLAHAGVEAVLVGETLMRSPDIGAKLRELLTPTLHWPL
jgi:indole-3-glycerol phosphate synthase